MPAQGSVPSIAPFITSKKFLVADGNPTIVVPQNAHTHQVAIESLDGTAGTATITVLPVGMIDEIPLLRVMALLR